MNLSEVYNNFSEFELPAWSELPDLDIYMDQLISLINRYFEGHPAFEDKGLTSSMVNNYVKQGILPAPVNKKYNKEHLASLIIICILKNSVPINKLGILIKEALKETDSCKTVYTRFCTYFKKIAEQIAASAKETGDESLSLTDSIICSSVRTHIQQSLTLGLLKELTVYSETHNPKKKERKK